VSDPGRVLDDLAPLFEGEPGGRASGGTDESARVAARLFYVDALLREAFAPKAAARPRGVLRWIGAGLAAAAAVAALLVWLVGPDGAAGAVARVERAEGATAGGRALAAGDAIYPGSDVRVAGSAAVVFADATRLDLKGGAHATFLSARQVAIARGAVEARVTPREPGETLVFSTPHGDARVVGTTLRLTVGASSTRLDVEEGKVRFTRPDRTAVEVTAGHFAVAAAGVELAPRRSTRGSDAAFRMAPNSWASLPDTAMRRVAVTRKEYPKLWPSAQGPGAMFTRSGGGALDTRRNRLYVWGGGFTHYHGNEMYAFDLEALAWERLTEPHPDPSLGHEENPDGTPVSRDVFGGFTYVAHADRVFACGGFLAGGNAQRARCTWMFDPAAKKWQNMRPSGALPPTGAYNTAVYDAAAKKIWWGDGNSGERGPGLYSYDVETNSWSRHSSHALSHYAAALDTRRRQLVFAGQGQVFSYDVTSPLTPRTLWATTGGEAFLKGEHVGFDYDPVSDRFLGWEGGAVYALDPEKKVWTSFDPPGGPARRNRDVLGRWRFVPAFGVFIAASGIDENVHFYKPPD
jgi:hypothetical protein